MLHELLNSKLGLVGGLFLMLIVGMFVMKLFADSLKWFVVIAVVALLLWTNRGSFLGGGAAVPGDAGDVLQVGQIGFQAQSEYEHCLDQALKNQRGPNKALVDSAGRVCSVAANRDVTACKARMKAAWWRWLVFDKEVYCQTDVGPSWGRCAEGALARSDDLSPVARCSSLKQVGIMQKVATMVSNGGALDPAPAAGLAYNPECLRIIFNAHLTEMAPPPVKATERPEPACDTMLADPVALQACVVRSINRGLKEKAAPLLEGCKAKP